MDYNLVPNSPLITVGLPFFNAEKTLRLAIESSVAQEFQNFELILVNDGSTDGSSRIAHEYLSDRRVMLLEDGKNLGLAPRLNQITALSRGDYIARMDADDVMHPSRLRKQISLLEADPSVDLVSSGVHVIDGSYRILGFRRTVRVRVCHKFSYLQLFHPTVTGRKRWFQRNPYSCEFLRCEDTELWIRTQGESNVVILDEPLLFFNRVGSFELEKTLRSLQQFRNILRLHRQRTCRWCRFASIMVTEAKAICYRILWCSGLSGAATARWSVEPLGICERELAEKALYSLIRDVKEREIAKLRAHAATVS